MTAARGKKSGRGLDKKTSKARVGVKKRAANPVAKSTGKVAKRKAAVAKTNKPHAKPQTKPQTKPPAKASPKLLPRSPIVDIALRAIDDMKGVNVTTLDVRGVTDIADHMIIASGNSDRHVRAIAERVVEFGKKAGYRPMGVEGERDGEWVLVDLQDVIVHVMLPRVREFYRLESLWDVTAARREAAGQ